MYKNKIVWTVINNKKKKNEMLVGRGLVSGQAAEEEKFQVALSYVTVIFLWVVRGNEGWKKINTLAGHWRCWYENYWGKIGYLGSVDSKPNDTKSDPPPTHQLPTI